MKAVIIAGGFGTRLRPLTYNIPKPIIPLVNLPFVFHQIELLKKYGIKDVILNLHYLPESMRGVFEEIKKLGIKLEYSIEEKPLGTAGAVKNAEEFFDSDLLLVFNGDILTDLDLGKLIDFHKKQQALVTLTLTRVDDPTNFGLVITDKEDRVKKFIEKPSWEQVTVNTINAGTYVVNPKIFEKVPPGLPCSFERELFPRLLAEGAGVFGYESPAYWLDIGNSIKYLKAHKDILKEEIKVNIPHKKKQGNIWLGDKISVENGARVEGPALIGNEVQLCQGAKISEFVTIGDQVYIGENSKITESVILAKTKIGKGVELKQCIIGFNCVIEDDVSIGHGTVLADHSWIKKGSRLG